MPNENEKHEKLAKDKLAELTKQREERQKKNAEARDAATDDQSGKEKTKEGDEQAAKDAQEAREKADAQAKEDKRILEAKTEDLSEEDKTRKVELDKLKDKGTDEDKAKVLKDAAQEKINSRIGELTSSIKKLESEGSKDKQTIESLKREVDGLKNPEEAKKSDPQEVMKKVMSDRATLHLEEDKGKPREERREISDEELNDWFIDDALKAQIWMTKHEVRLSEDRKQLHTLIEAKKMQKDIQDRQAPYVKKINEAHPELNTTKREDELIAEGKNPTEVHNTLLKENEKYRLADAIVREHPGYLTKDNGPELVVQEMEKRLSKKETPKKEDNPSKDEEKDKKIAELEEELARRDDEDGGITSTRSAEKKAEDKPKSDIEKQRVVLAGKAGISEEKLAARVEHRKKRGLM